MVWRLARQPRSEFPLLTLYDAPASRSARIVWLLKGLGADYTLRHVGIRDEDGLVGVPDPANVYPDERVPALGHDDILVTESTAVAISVCDLLPRPGHAPVVGHPDRGAFQTQLCWNNNELRAAILARMFGQPNAPFARGGYDSAVRRSSEALVRDPNLLAARFSAADVMIGPLSRIQLQASA